MIEIIIEKQRISDHVLKYICWNESRAMVIGPAYNLNAAIDLARGYMNEHYPYHLEFRLTIKDATDG